MSTAIPESSVVQESTPLVPELTLKVLKLPQALETAWMRWLFLVLALLVAVGFFCTVRRFFNPGPGFPGIDENAYLVGGKNVADHFSPGMKPSTPYAYIGPMWMRAENGWYYPKYPFGVPLLNGIAIWIGGGHNNLSACYVSPVCAALSVLSMFLLTRALAGSFFGLLGAIVLACNPTLLQLSLVPGSHAPALCFSLSGMFVLICWWRSGKMWQGILAGLLLGFAVTIRYTEALLLFPLYPLDPLPKSSHPVLHYAFYLVRCLPVGPMGLACLCAVRWKRRKTWIRAGLPIVAWVLPVGTLLIFNWFTLHSLTGYDSTHESTGFTLSEFRTKWEYTIGQLHLYGLFLVLPLGIAGMMLMTARCWRAGMLLVLWFFPALILYMAYYWGMQTPGVGYLRFFLTLYPPVIASGMWLLANTFEGVRLRTENNNQLVLASGWRNAPAVVAMCLFVTLPALAGLYVALPDMERQRIFNGNLTYSAHQFLLAAPETVPGGKGPKPLLIADDGGIFSRTLMYMQFAVDGEWYATTAFSPMGGGRGIFGAMGRMFGGGRNAGNDDSDNPNPVLFDPARTAYIESVYKKLTVDDFAREEVRVLKEALDATRPIYALVSPNSAGTLRERLDKLGFDCQMIATWMEPLRLGREAGGMNPQPGQGNRARGGPGGRGGFPGNQLGGLSPGGGGVMFGGNLQQTLQVLRIRAKAAAIQPATQEVGTPGL